MVPNEKHLPELSQWTQTDTGMRIVAGGVLYEVMSSGGGAWHAFADGKDIASVSDLQATVSLLSASMRSDDNSAVAPREHEGPVAPAPEQAPKRPATGITPVLGPSHYYNEESVRTIVEADRHRGIIGGLWEELGSLQLDYLRSQGMQSSHRLLDIGCGSLRLGVKAVSFLDAGNYFGTDLSPSLLEVGYQKEILPAGLGDRLPRANLVADGEFTFEGVPRDLDFVIAQSVFTHLPLNHMRLCLARLAKHVSKPCRVFFTVFLAPSGREAEAIEQYPGIISHPHKDPYHYRTNDIRNAVEGLPWEVESIGPWGHPRNQMMVRLRSKDLGYHENETIPTTRSLSSVEAKKLSAGAQHYTAYVGPPNQWDFMGATQFRLLTALGLRQHQKVLDIGCGSLRAGKFLISYLDRGNYFGIEPNTWLVEDAISNEVGRDLIDLKRPTFSSSREFDALSFGEKFDFIVAQSIFSHAGPELVEVALGQIARTLSREGLALFTFIHPEKMPGVPREAVGWTYPGCTTYAHSRVLELMAAAGLTGLRLPWYHPRQTWYAAGSELSELSMPEVQRHLSGAVLRDREFADSVT